jgi:hypothetical protein
MPPSYRQGFDPGCAFEGFGLSLSLSLSLSLCVCVCVRVRMCVFVYMPAFSGEGVSKWSDEWLARCPYPHVENHTFPTFSMAVRSVALRSKLIVVSLLLVMLVRVVNTHKHC